MSVCLLMRGRKGMDLDEGGGRDAVSAVDGQGNCNQDMLCEKKYAFNKRENIFRIARFGAQVTLYCV